MVAVAVAALALAGAALGASGCGEDRDALTIYSGRTEDLVGPLLERFSEEQDVAVDVRYGDTAELALLLAEEGDRSPADVFWGQSPGATAYLWTRRFRRMLLIAPLVAWVSCVVGILLSFNLDVSTGGTIVLVQSGIFCLTYLFAPREGLVRALLARR